MLKQTIRLATLSAAAVLLMAAMSQAATIPYVEDFEDDIGSSTPSEPAPESGTFAIDSGPGFETPQSVNSTWEVIDTGVASNNVYENILEVTADQGGDGSDGGVSEAFLQMVNVGNKFRVTYDFEIENLNVPGTQSRTGFDLLADSGGTSSDGYRVMYPTTGGTEGQLNILVSGESNGSSGATVVPVAVDQAYTMTIDGVFVTSGLNLTATISDGTNSATASISGSTAFSGQYFGFRNFVFDLDNNNTASSMTVRFDNLTIIPEPASLGLISLGGLAALRRRRR